MYRQGNGCFVLGSSGQVVRLNNIFKQGIVPVKSSCSGTDLIGQSKSLVKSNSQSYTERAATNLKRNKDNRRSSSIGHIKCQGNQLNEVDLS